MRALYFDTETTGLRADAFLLGGVVYPGKICQLAYLIEEEGALSAHNYYFDVPAVDPCASNVTGLTVEVLRELSGGLKFEDVADEIWQDFAAADVLIAHKFDFDERFMRTEFARLGMSFNEDNKGFCTMRGFTPILRLPGYKGRWKSPSLHEFAEAEGVRPQEIDEMMRAVFGASSHVHDARYDTVMMYLALDKACRADMILAHQFGKL